MRVLDASGTVISLAMKPRNYTRLLVHWIPAILWAAVILSFSSDLFSAKHTGDVLRDILLRIVGHSLPPRQFDLLHFLIRKAAHLTEYCILGALLFRAVRGDEGGWRMRWAVVAVALAACVATTDEWHQLFVPSRTSSPWDVLLDFVGATIAQALWRYNSRS